MEGGESGPNLKGSLVDKTKPESKLRGSLTSPKIPQIENPVGVLRGDLVDKIAKPSPELPIEGFAIGQEFVQRDSGKIFKIMGLTESRHGLRINLIGPDGNKFTTDPGHLQESLDTEKGAWSRKSGE